MLNSSSSKSNNSTQHFATTKQSKSTNEPKVEPVSLMVRPPPLYPSPSTSFANIGNNNVVTTPNFTLISRLGRQVKLDMTTEIPAELALQLERVEKEDTEEESELKEEHILGFFNFLKFFSKFSF